MNEDANNRKLCVLWLFSLEEQWINPLLPEGF